MAHQTIQSSAAIGTFNAIASHTIPQALPLMPGIVPGIAPTQQGTSATRPAHPPEAGTQSIDVMRLNCS